MPGPRSEILLPVDVSPLRANSRRIRSELNTPPPLTTIAECGGKWGSPSRWSMRCLNMATASVASTVITDVYPVLLLT